MCGIVGTFNVDGRRASEEVLRAMAATIVHRGPDDDGFFVDGPVGLGMRRLSIIGVSNGRQPIFNEDRTVAIVMNGELYNYRDLKQRLETAGHVIRTASDVEVAVHRYEDTGAEFVSDLRGMFAFALHDAKTRCVLLGRDRVGKKPLYYAFHDGCLVFASEIKAILASGLIAKEIDHLGLRSYLSHGFVPGERTLFAGISKVPPGCLLKADASGIQVRPYWDFPLPEPSQRTAPSFDDAAAHVRELLEEAVRVRLMSEVPLGAFLSGGVDSSAIVGIMSRELSRPVETFAVGFADAEFDELEHARRAADLYKTNHHEVLVRGCDPTLLRELNWYHDEPAADPATVPTLCLARFARQRVTVALTGEGGDELFAGYRHYRLYRRLAALERTVDVRPLAHLLMRLEPFLGAVGPRRLWKGVWIAGMQAPGRVRGLVSVFTDHDIDHLLGAHGSNASAAYDEGCFDSLWTRTRNADPIAQAMYVDAKAQLPEQLLMKVDKTTMAASLEARCPFLDHELIAFVGRLPTAMKIGGDGTKLLLRKALRGLVPDPLLDRAKHGFEVPVRKWMLSDLRATVDSTLLHDDAPIASLLSSAAIRRLWQRLTAHDDPQLARQVWTLLNLAVWLDIHWGAA